METKKDLKKEFNPDHLYEYIIEKGVGIVNWNQNNWEEYWEWVAKKNAQFVGDQKWDAKYFTEKELLRTSYVAIDNNWLDKEHRQDALIMCKEMLDPIREEWGSAIRITSGYRTPRLNKAIKGANNSQHIYGQAVDIVPLEMKPTSMDTLFALIIAMSKENTIEFDQIIHSGSWIHISYSKGNNRLEKLHKTSKGYQHIH